VTLGDRILPTNLRDFLKAQGWHVLHEALADRQYVLENPSHPMRQLAYPMDRTAPDYEDSVDTVVRKFAEISRDNVRSILYRINSVGDDILRLRLFRMLAGTHYLWTLHLRWSEVPKSSLRRLHVLWFGLVPTRLSVSRDCLSLVLPMVG